MNALMQSQSAKPSFWQASRSWLAQALTQQQSFSAYLQPLIQLAVPTWSTDAYRAQVIEIRDEMADMYSLVLKPETGFLDRLWPSFQAGQFVELMVDKEGSRTSRCFSISSSPAYYEKTGLIELSIRIQQKGRITPWVRQNLKPGQLLNLSQPQGDFVLPENLLFSQQPGKLLFIAGGSGITPFRSMLHQFNSGSHKGLDVQLLYYSRDDQQVLFQQELQQLEKDYDGLTITFVDSERDGFICREHLQTYCSDYDQRTTYICGPSPMIQQARKVLTDLELAEEKIHFEYFGAAPVELDANQQGAILFQASEKTIFSSSDKVQTLLEQAEEEGIKPVSGCRIGVCHQCICKKKSGVVFNTRTQEYSDTGQQEIQLCISVAQGDVVLDL